jgi:murein DD-endopeptidase MepM/ murein hydrolase activator NlpD
MYRQAVKIGSPILAAAGGVVHEWFDPGGLEIRHGGGWFTVYLHISKRIASGTKVERGDWIGTMGSVGTH